MQRTPGHAASEAYTGVVALIVGEMLLYTLFGPVYLVTPGVNHPTSIFWLSVYVMMTVRTLHLRSTPRVYADPQFFSASYPVQCLSPQMIILRVLMGRAWSQDAVSGTIAPSPSTCSDLNSNPNTARFSAMTMPSPNRARFTYNSEVTAINLKAVPSKVPLAGSREFRDSKTLVDVPRPPSPGAWTIWTTTGTAP